MSQKVILIILFAAFLSACQHTSERSDTTVYSPPPTQQQTYPNDSQNRPTTTYPSPPASQTRPHTSTLPSASTTSQTTYSNNVLDRIRAGFRFPHLDSKYIKEYENWNATHPRYLKDLFARAEPFLPYIVGEIEKRGIPMEIALLPAIESAYKPNAVSRSKAAGLWQFIPSTGRSFGLTQDWWYDGRRDVILSTQASLDYLTQLNKRFNGDWFITLAAYNAGQGNIARAIKKNRRAGKSTDYSSLSLRSETRRYVPKIIALKNIINNPHAFNVRLPVIHNSPKFEVLPLKGQIDLNKFAEETGYDSKTLNHLNAGFLRWATSPNGPHRLLLPINDQVKLQKARIAAQKTIKLDYQRHQIARGDTLSTIARRYGVSVRELKSTNKLSSSRIRAGKTLLIPYNGERVAAATSKNNINTSNSVANKPVASFTPSGVAVATPVSSTSFVAAPIDNKVVHQVRKGDTLWGIARQYKVKIEQLLQWNQLSRNQTLRLNQSLVLFP